MIAHYFKQCCKVELRPSCGRDFTVCVSLILAHPLLVLTGCDVGDASEPKSGEFGEDAGDSESGVGPKNDEEGESSEAGDDGGGGQGDENKVSESGVGDEGGDEEGDGGLDEGGDTDDVSGCMEINCDPGAQECESPEQKCNPWRCFEGCCTNSTRCVDITGDQQEGDECYRNGTEQSDNCAPGLFCMPHERGSGEDGPGECVQMCSPEVGGPGNCAELNLPGQHCFGFNQGSLPICMETCDPFLRDCEHEGEECYLVIDNFICLRPTTPQGDGGGGPGRPGDACLIEQGCGGGSVCAPAQISADCDNENCSAFEVCGCCAVVCDLSADDPNEVCEDDQECLPAIDHPSKEVEHFGICGVAN